MSGDTAACPALCLACGYWVATNGPLCESCAQSDSVFDKLWARGLRSWPRVDGAIVIQLDPFNHPDGERIVRTTQVNTDGPVTP